MPVLGHLASARAPRGSRGRARRKLHLEAGASTQGSEAVPVLIHNLSATGLLIETTASLPEGELIEVSIPQVGVTTAKVMWSSVPLFGCEFTEPLPAESISAALWRTSFDAPVTREATLPHEAPARWSRRARSWTVIGLAVVAWVVFAGLTAWIAGSVLA